MIDFLAVCGFGLESLLCRELQQLGYDATSDSAGHVRFSGDESAIARCNTWLRTADRVLILLGESRCTDFDELFSLVSTCGWERWIGPEDAFTVTAHSVRSQLSSVPAIQRTVKKSVAQRLMQAHSVSQLPEQGVNYAINLGLVGDLAKLTIDTTGISLHRRGYLTRYPRGALKETLAAGLVKLSFWERNRPLLDPFCGTGTILIEAAMIGCNIAPGRNRNFASESWPQVPQAIWDEVRRDADQQQLEDLEIRLIGMDVDAYALKQARAAAEWMGVEQSIHFQPASFDRAASKRKYGCVVTNLPTSTSQNRSSKHQSPADRPSPGDRPSNSAFKSNAGQQRTSQDAMIRAIPEVLRKFPTWSHFILSDHPQFEKLIGRAANKKRKLYNDRNQCFFYQYAGPKPPTIEDEFDVQNDVDHNAANQSAADEVKQTAEKQKYPRPSAASQLPAAFGELTPKCHEQAELFARRLVKRAKHLRRWPSRQGISCFRLYERDIPEIPLVVDRYEDHLHITEYERPHDRDPALHASWLDLMARTASKTLEVPPEKVFFKRRGRQQGDLQYQQVDAQKYEIEVSEGGLKFLVNLSDYVDTGLFLDHRITRSMVRDEVRGKRFLNLFAYTGAFTVYAADAPAISTVTVDWSNQYLQWAQRNLELNGFLGDQHQFVRADAATFVAGLPEKTLFDLAVIDPPTFSNSKRTEDIWDVQAGYAKLLNDVLRRMDTGGIIYFSNNYRRFKFDADQIEASEKHEISNQTVPPDFRNRRIHRCWRIVK